jgi:hypothetical protein
MSRRRLRHNAILVYHVHRGEKVDDQFDRDKDTEKSAPASQTDQILLASEDILLVLL